MGKYHKITDMLEGELMKIGSEGKLTNTSLEVGDKAAHFLKSIKTIEAMDEAENGESYRGGRSYNYDDGYTYDGMSYARGRGRYAKRDSMGRYASENRGGMSRGGYSREYSGNKHELMMELDQLKDRIEGMED